MIIRGAAVFAGPVRFTNTIDVRAHEHLEVSLHPDGIMRINIDGKCAFRVTVGNSCVVEITTPVNLVDI